MTTITALQLRNNLGDIMRRVQAGEEIAVTYRGVSSIRLSSENKPKKTMAGLEAFLAADVKIVDPAPTRSFKQLYHEHLEEKYGSSK